MCALFEWFFMVYQALLHCFILFLELSKRDRVGSIASTVLKRKLILGTWRINQNQNMKLYYFPIIPLSPYMPVYNLEEQSIEEIS